MQEITPVLLSTLTMALTQIVKVADFVPRPERFMPVVSLGIGVGLGLLAGFDVFSSIMVGATASGFYDLTTKTVLDKS